MPTTHNHIWYPDNTDELSPLENVFSALAYSVDENLGLPLFASAQERDIAFDRQPFKLAVVGTSYEDGVLFTINDGIWEQVGDFLAPSEPSSVGVTSITYNDSSGWARARALVSWTNPTTAATGQTMTPATLEVWSRQGASGSFWLQTSTAYPDDDVVVNDLETSTSYQFKVRAVSKSGAPGEFSAAKSHTTAASGGGGGAVTPGSFSVSSKMLMVTIDWNGRDSSGNKIPADQNMFVERSQSSNFANAVTVGTYPGGVTAAVDGPLVKGQRYYYRLRTYDLKGNPSSPSYSNSVVVRGISQGGLIIGSIHANSVDAGVLNGTIITGVTINGTVRITSPYISGGNIVGGSVSTNGNASSDSIYMNDAGLKYRDPYGDILWNFKTYSDGGGFYIRDVVNPAATGGIQFDDTYGLRAWDSGGRQRLTISRTGYIAVHDGTITGGTITGANVVGGRVGTKESNNNAIYMNDSGLKFRDSRGNLRWHFKTDGTFYMADNAFPESGGIKIDSDYGMQAWKNNGVRTLAIKKDGYILVKDGNIDGGVVTGSIVQTSIGGTNNRIQMWVNGSQPMIEFWDKNSHHFSLETGMNELGIQRVEPNSTAFVGVLHTGRAKITGQANTSYVQGTIMVSNDSRGGYQSGRVYSTSIVDRVYSNAANVYITGSGTLGLASSSRRYKASIESAPDWKAKFLSLTPSTWIDEGNAAHLSTVMDEEIMNGQADWDNEDIEPIRRLAGFVAEDVHDAGLADFVVYDSKGRPNSLEYTKMVAMAQQVLVDHEQRIKKLEGDTA